MNQVGELGIEKLQINTFMFLENFQSRVDSLYDPLVKNSPLGQQLVSSLAADPRVLELDGTMSWLGYSGKHFDVHALVRWHLWCINEYGINRANEYLNLFLDSESFEAMATLWVLGIELDAPIHLESGVIIQPIENMPDSNEKEIFSAAHFRPFTFFGSNALPRVAITTTYLENKKGSPDVTNTKRITVERACFNDLHPILNDIALLLNALPNVVCVPHVSTAYVQQTIPNGIFSNPGYGSQLVDVATFNSRKIDSAIGPEIDLLLSSFNSLPIKERSRLRLILRRLSQAKRRTQLEDKMLDIGLALEMLLIDDSKTDTQLSLTFRIRGSWLTGKSGTERLENWELLKQIYNARSDVAHTGELSGGKAAAIQKIQDNVPKYVQLAENILRKIIIDGRPDWTSLILDSALHATEES